MKSSKRPATGSSNKTSCAEDDKSLFHLAVSGVTPLSHAPRIQKRSQFPRSPVRLRDNSEAPGENSNGAFTLETATDWSEETHYLRQGMRRDTIRKLRGGQCAIQDTIDLHGANREEARLLLAEFMGSCREQGIRCVRIIHGKGLRSPNNEPVLRNLIRGWLTQLDNVLACCEAPPRSGGSGATLVLLASD